jgi:Domain of unknown function (DUF4345)
MYLEIMKMQDSKVLRGALFMFGALLLVLGGWRVTDPVAFHAHHGLTIEASAGMLNEARGAGGAVVGFALVILSGAFVDQLRFTSTVAAAVLFLSYAAARLYGFASDGHPGAMVIQGITFEIIFGAAAVALMLKYRTRAQAAAS